MKKRTFAAVALTMLLLVGCAEQPPSYDNTENESQLESSMVYSETELPETGTSSFLAGEESGLPVISEVSETETSAVSVQEQTEAQKPAVSSEPKQEEQHQYSIISQPAAIQEEKESASQPEQPQSTVITPSAPVASESQTQPAPMEPETAAFDISGCVQFAKEYGLQLGLSLDSTATACWDDPLTANAGCRYLERDLKDRLDWYKASGFTAFWVWAEQVAAGEYLIYIGYA